MVEKMNFFAASYEVSIACNLCKITQQAAGELGQLFVIKKIPK